MISYRKALKIMGQNIKVSPKIERINIFKSHKRIISKNILAKTDSPRSNLSAMDGIVIFKTELKKNNNIYNFQISYIFILCLFFVYLLINWSNYVKNI